MEARLMHFVDLGDSITYGEGASSYCRAYPSVLASMLQGSRGKGNFTGDVLAYPGWTSGALENAVIETGPIPISSARFVVIWVGGDNLVHGGLAALHGSGSPANVIKQSLATYGLHLGKLLHYVRRTTRAPMLVCTQYNPFPNSPIAVQGIGALNDVTATVVAASGGQLVPSGTWFQGRQAQLIAGYRTGTLRDAMGPQAPIHPNDTGHRVIAEGLYAQLAPILRV